QERLDDVMSALKMHSIPHQQMPQRYESDEEEISEADAPSLDDQLYSPVGSDTCGGDSDQRAFVSPANSPQTDFTFRMPSPSPGPEAPKTPICNNNAKRGSCLTLMAPKSRLEDNEKQFRKSYGPYRESPSFQNTHFFSSMLVETDTASPIRKSMCSDVFSSDEELGPETRFLIATSVVYHVPNSKPNLISVGPSATPSAPSTSPTPHVAEQQKKRPAPLDLAPSRRLSTNTTRTTTSVRTRLSRLMTTKQDKRRGSYFIQLPNSSESSIVPTPSFSVPNWKGAEATQKPPESEPEPPPEHNPVERDSWFSNRGSNTSSRYSSQSQNSPMSPQEAKDESSKGLSRSSGFTKRIASRGQKLSIDSTPLPQPSTLSSAAPRLPAPEPKKKFGYSLMPSPDVSISPYPTGLRAPVSSRTLHNVDLTPPRSSHSREKAYSIKSGISNSSKLSLSPFDTTSFKGLAQRYSRAQIFDDPATQRRPSGSPIFMGRNPDGKFRDGRLNSTTSLALPRASTFAVPEEHDLEQEKKSSGKKHKHSPSKSMKWFQDKGGNMSQAGSKALTGLGSMIRTKIS
ncbi:hypothetical protein LOZ29_000452, partial [Ophidiomyces ophidiicola]